MKITALKSTFLKKQPLQSSVLAGSELKFVNQGWNCPVVKIYEEKDNHYKIELGYNAGFWWVYKPHISLEDTIKSSGEIKGDLAQIIVDVCIENDISLRRGNNQLNLVAIEGFNKSGTFNEDTPDKWNDMFYVIEFLMGKPQLVFHAICTTEPGDYYTRNPLNHNGAARLDLGYHKNLWQLGYHRGYRALVQGDNVARLVRDRNKNHKRDEQVSYEQWNGINLHTTKTTGWKGHYSESSIGRWSAGCVVIKSFQKFQKLMKVITQSIEVIGNGNNINFDFVLLNEDMFKERANTCTTGYSKFDTFDKDDVDIMARTIYGEARGESVNGRIAVGWVIRNRAQRSPKYNWSDNIASVCMQKYQFSCWNENDPNRGKLLSVEKSDTLFSECLEIAAKVLEGQLPDKSNGADHYYADYIDPPNWSNENKLVAQIGVHLFFRLI